jgi:hypothetical protein
MKRLAAAIITGVMLGCAGVAGASQRDGATIVNSGSTNFSGYTIKVWSDGSTSAVHSGRAGNRLDAPVPGHIPQDVAGRFISEARQARERRVSSQPCMKSASFGTTTVVTYHGWTSPDLECPGDGYAVALGSDAHKIVALLKFQGMPSHPVHLLPNEPRRAPSETPASGQPSATPEPSASPS